MLDIIDYANCKKVPGAVLFIDLCKAFDPLKWSFIFEMLRLYGFGSKIMKWIKILCKKPKCRVINKVPVPNKARLLKRPTILIFFSGANKNSVLFLTKS